MSTLVQTNVVLYTLNLPIFYVEVYVLGIRRVLKRKNGNCRIYTQINTPMEDTWCFILGHVGLASQNVFYCSICDYVKCCCNLKPRKFLTYDKNTPVKCCRYRLMVSINLGHESIVGIFIHSKDHKMNVDVEKLQNNSKKATVVFIAKQSLFGQKVDLVTGGDDFGVDAIPLTAKRKTNANSSPYSHKKVGTTRRRPYSSP